MVKAELVAVCVSAGEAAASDQTLPEICPEPQQQICE